MRGIDPAMEWLLLSGAQRVGVCVRVELRTI